MVFPSKAGLWEVAVGVLGAGGRSTHSTVVMDVNRHLNGEDAAAVDAPPAFPSSAGGAAAGGAGVIESVCVGADTARVIDSA